MTREKAIDRVRKLLALANDKAATDAEAAQARYRANKLVDEWGLASEEIIERPEPRRRRPAPPPPPPQPGVVIRGPGFVFVFGSFNGMAGHQTTTWTGANTGNFPFG
jgi:hypothetical protein